MNRPLEQPERLPPRVREVFTDSGLRTFFYSVDSPSFEMSEKLSKFEGTGVDLGREYISLVEAKSIWQGKDDEIERCHKLIEEHQAIVDRAVKEARTEAFREAAEMLKNFQALKREKASEARAALSPKERPK